MPGAIKNMSWLFRVQRLSDFFNMKGERIAFNEFRKPRLKDVFIPQRLQWQLCLNQLKKKKLSLMKKIYASIRIELPELVGSMSIQPIPLYASRIFQPELLSIVKMSAASIRTKKKRCACLVQSLLMQKDRGGKRKRRPFGHRRWVAEIVPSGFELTI